MTEICYRLKIHSLLAAPLKGRAWVACKILRAPVILWLDNNTSNYQSINNYYVRDHYHYHDHEHHHRNHDHDHDHEHHYHDGHLNSTPLTVSTRNTTIGIGAILKQLLRLRAHL